MPFSYLKNNTKSISLAKYLNIRENNNLQVLGDLFSLPVVKKYYRSFNIYKRVTKW